MKRSLVLILPVFLGAGVHADVLSNLSPLLGSPAPTYDPAALEPDLALQHPEYAPFSPADSDLGMQQILGTYPGYSPVEVSFETSASYTDNAPSESSLNDEAAWFWASRLLVSWRPRIAYGWFADVGMEQSIYRFEGSRAQDFENFEPYVGIVKSIPDLDDLVFFTRYEYQRLTTGSLSEGDYSAQRIRTGFQKDLLLAPRYRLSAGLDAAFDIEANPDDLERNAYSADLTFTYRFAEKLSSTVSWRGEKWDFRQGGRDDWSQTIGLELTWEPCKDVRIFTNVFYTNINSNAALGANDYEAWQTGLGLGLNYSF
jgi:hypothetical protein